MFEYPPRWCTYSTAAGLDCSKKKKKKTDRQTDRQTDLLQRRCQAFEDKLKNIKKSIKYSKSIQTDRPQPTTHQSSTTIHAKVNNGRHTTTTPSIQHPSPPPSHPVMRRHLLSQVTSCLLYPSAPRVGPTPHSEHRFPAHSEHRFPAHPRASVSGTLPTSLSGTPRSSLSGTFLQTVADLVTPLKGHSMLSPFLTGRMFVR